MIFVMTVIMVIIIAVVIVVIMFIFNSCFHDGFSNDDFYCSYSCVTSGTAYTKV